MHTLQDVENTYSRNYFFSSFISDLLIKNLRKKAIKKLNLKPGDEVLDIACGKGQNFKYINKLIGKKGKIVGIDYTKEMLNQANKLIKRNNWKNTNLIKADASKYKSKTKFDAIISTIGLSSIPDHKNALKIAVNSLKKGKKLVILDGKPFNITQLNLIMPILRWNKSYDKNKDLIQDIKQLFPKKQIMVKEYISNFILELTNFYFIPNSLSRHTSRKKNS